MADFRKMRVADLEDFNNVIILPATILSVDDVNCTASVEYKLDAEIGIGCEDVSAVPDDDIPIFYHCQFYEDMVDSGEISESDAFSFGALAFNYLDQVYVIHYPGNAEKELPGYTYIAGHIGKEETPLCQSDYIFIYYTAPDSNEGHFFCTVFDVLSGTTISPKLFDAEADFTFPCLYTTEVLDWLNVYFWGYSNPDPPVWDQGYIIRRNSYEESDQLYGYLDETPVSFEVYPFAEFPTYTPEATSSYFTRILDDIPYTTDWPTQPTPEPTSGDSYTGYGFQQYGVTIYSDTTVDKDMTDGISSYFFRVHDDGTSTISTPMITTEITREVEIDGNDNIGESEHNYYIPWIGGGTTPYNPLPEEDGLYSVKTYNPYYIIGTHGLYFIHITKFYTYDSVFWTSAEASFRISAFIAFYTDLCGTPVNSGVCSLDGMSLDTIFSTPQRQSITSGLEDAINDMTKMIEDEQVDDGTYYLTSRNNYNFQLIKPKTT